MFSVPNYESVRQVLLGSEQALLPFAGSMRIPLDECLPAAMQKRVSGHSCSTIQGLGLSGINIFRLVANL
jgi:hypothetical protein